MNEAGGNTTSMPRQDPHTAIIVCGSPAAGKSTYALELARRRTAALLDIDVVAARLVEKGLELAGRDYSNRDSQFFKQTFRQPIYETLFDIAAQNLALLDVIIVGPFTKELRESNWPEVLHRRLNGDVEIHYIYCRPEVRLERMRARGHLRDQDKLKDWEAFNRYYGEEECPCFEHVCIDNSEPIID